MDNVFSALLEKLENYAKGCVDKCLDMQSLKFESKENEMRLFTDTVSYFFKNDPENPKHPKVIHGAKQFCKTMGVPYSFFSKNPEYMKNQMVSCWLPTLKGDKSAILAKLRVTPQPDKFIIRALLPIEYTNISNYDIMLTISEVIGDNFKLWYAIGDERDDLILNVRFISNDSFEIAGESCLTGFSVTVSELGAAPISVDTLLYRSLSKSAMTAIYGGESFFSVGYEGIQPAIIKELFPRLMTHLKDQLCEVRERIQSATEMIEKKDDIFELLKNFRLRKGLSEKFHTLLFQEVTADDIKNRWDLVSRISILAKEFDPIARIKIEKLAGELIGLSFDKV